MYYLIEISVTNSGIAKAIWDKDNLDTAMMQLHQTLASAMASENVSSCMCMIIDYQGMALRHEYWEREIVVPEE